MSKTTNGALKRVILESGREISLKNRHPWVFSGAVRKTEGVPDDGDLVEVIAHTGQFLAAGHWGIEGIAVRILSFAPLPDPEEFLCAAFARALAQRSALGLIGLETTTAWRLINAEGDGLPGLVVDLYGRTAVIQCHSQGMVRWKELIVQTLSAMKDFPIEAIVDRSPGATGHAGQVIYGRSPAVEFLENGLRFGVDCLRGQKTGFFLDQRDNRAAVERLAKGRSVLNAFCYTGGFSIYALRGGAKRVLSVDISNSAISELAANLARNQWSDDRLAAHSSVAADCMEFLKAFPPEFDLVVLDPPAFVKHQGALRGGLGGYEAINAHAIRQVLPRGLVVTFSCSQFVSREMFRKVVFKAAARTGRPQVVAELSSGSCHPVSIYHPEGTYLKGLVLYVD